MKIKNHSNKPFFSICIPQYNRTKHLIEACKILEAQKFNDFEVCISDDCSTDGLQQELVNYLSQSGLSFVYQRQEKTLRYDGNIRASISLASGQYCLLFGNDDCLLSNNTLNNLYGKIIEHHYPAVVITNYEDWKTGNITKRIFITELVSGGVDTAVKNYRSVAFVSGVAVSRDGAVCLETNRWDGSEMYQMYIVASLLAGGGNLLKLEDIAVRKDITIQGEVVDSFENNKIPISKGFILDLPIHKIGRVISDAISPYVKDMSAYDANSKIFKQLYKFTYPYWIMQYKNAHGWLYSFRYVLSIYPSRILKDVGIGFLTLLDIYFLYFTMSIFGLTIPFSVYKLLEKKLHSMAKL